MENVDVLTPPDFRKSGIVKSRTRAIQDGDWIGTFNLWILRSDPDAAILYQKRSAQTTLEPGKLDVSAAGHYQAGESIYDGLREVKEELGRSYRKDQLAHIGRKLYIGIDAHGYQRNNVVEIFFVTDNSPLSTCILEKEEVSAVMFCPVEKLIKVHTHNIPFTIEALSSSGTPETITVSQNSFPYNWDNYHYKVALLAQRYLSGEKSILY